MEKMMPYKLLMPLFLMVLGFLLMFIEVSIIPGFGLIGIAGLGLLGAGVVLIWTTAGAIWGILAIAFSVPVFVAALWLFFKSKASRALSLERRIEGDSSSVPSMSHLIGRAGTAKSPLRPSGIALIGKTRYDVVTDGEFIEKGETVVVVQIDTNSIVVDRPTEE